MIFLRCSFSSTRCACKCNDTLWGNHMQTHNLKYNAASGTTECANRKVPLALQPFSEFQASDKKLWLWTTSILAKGSKNPNLLFSVDLPWQPRMVLLRKKRVGTLIQGCVLCVRHSKSLWLQTSLERFRTRCEGFIDQSYICMIRVVLARIFHKP